MLQTGDSGVVGQQFVRGMHVVLVFRSNLHLQIANVTGWRESGGSVIFEKTGEDGVVSDRHFLSSCIERIEVYDSDPTVE